MLDRALAKDPENRWQSARDLKAALELIAAPAPPPPAPPPRRHSRARWAAAAIFGLIASVLAWVQWGPALASPDPPAITADASRIPQLALLDRRGRMLGSIGASADYSNPAISPDGKRVAVSIRDSTRRRDIWIFDLPQGSRTALTSEPADETNPVWSPDGSEIIYCSDRLGQRDIYSRRSGGGPEQLVYSSGINKNPLDWARDGSLYFNVDRADVGHDIWVLSLRGAEKGIPRVFLHASENRDWLAVSPDNHWVLFRAGGRPGNRIVLRTLESEKPEWPVASNGTSEGHWRADSRQIYYIAGRTMMAQDIEIRGAEPVLGKPTPLFQVPQPYDFGRNAFSVSPDGQRFLLRIGP